MTHLVHSLEELQTFAQELVSELAPQPVGATVIALSGDLGAGKTSLVQAIARELGIADHVTSPTYVLEKKYTLTDQQFSSLIHIDAYRLTKPEELDALDWNILIADPSHLICIEWPERVAEYIPETAIAVSCRGIDDTTHEYTV